MHPVLIDLGGFKLHTYGFLGAVGFLCVVFVILRRANAAKLDRDHVVDVIFWGAIAGVVGSRALFVWQNLDVFEGPAGWFNLRTGGLVFYGALLLGLPVGAVVIWLRRLPFLKLMDMIGAALPLGHGITRVGCLLAGCCWGLPTDFPWGVVYDHPLAAAPHDVALHPVQLYESALLFGIFAAVNAFYPHRRADGHAMALYLLLYAGVRTVTELFRGDVSRGFVWEGMLGQAISTSQAISALVALTAVALFFAGRHLAPIERRA